MHLAILSFICHILQALQVLCYFFGALFAFFIQTGQFGLTGNKANEKEDGKIGKDRKSGFDLMLSKVQLHSIAHKEN